MHWFIWIIIAIIAWFILGQLWRKVVYPYFRHEVIHVRTSVIPEQYDHANRIDDNMCCICLAEPKNFRVVATCSHSFCADCIFGIFKARNKQKIDCPLCRKDIVNLFKSFKQTEPAEKIGQIRNSIREFNQQFGDDRSIIRKVKELPFVLTQTLNYVFSPQFLLFLLGNSLFIKGLLAIIVYLMVPVQTLSVSYAGSAGYVDDLIFIALVILFVIYKLGLVYVRNQQ